MTLNRPTPPNQPSHHSTGLNPHRSSHLWSAPHRVSFAAGSDPPYRAYSAANDNAPLQRGIRNVLFSNSFSNGLGPQPLGCSISGSRTARSRASRQKTPSCGEMLQPHGIWASDAGMPCGASQLSIQDGQAFSGVRWSAAAGPQQSPATSATSRRERFTMVGMSGRPMYNTLCYSLVLCCFSAYFRQAQSSSESALRFLPKRPQKTVQASF